MKDGLEKNLMRSDETNNKILSKTTEKKMDTN